MTSKMACYGDYKRKQQQRKIVIAVICAVVVILIAGVIFVLHARNSSLVFLGSNSDFNIPQYTGSIYVEINDNIPFFMESDLTTEPYEKYSSLDKLGRCGPAMCCICRETMPTEERGPIGMIKPSGWHTVRYDDLIEDKYLYNRCHLIAFMLSGENDNECNLITGTRYMNVSGMLPFENKTASYIRKTGNHVLYRVTPYFEKENLVASGVLMEAYSVEDSGAGLAFNIFVFNVQPGIVIDYKTGDSHRG